MKDMTENTENIAEKDQPRSGEGFSGAVAQDGGGRWTGEARAAYLEKGRKTLGDMLGMLDIKADVRISEEERAPRLEIEADNAGRLIGKRGQTLECLELILNRVLSNAEEKGRAEWISIAVDGYCVASPEAVKTRPGKLPREEVDRLECLAHDIAREVKMLGKPRVIGPYSPGERRIIHLALENDPDVETVSDAEADQNRGKKITVRLRS